MAAPPSGCVPQMASTLRSLRGGFSQKAFWSNPDTRSFPARTGPKIITGLRIPQFRPAGLQKGVAIIADEMRALSDLGLSAEKKLALTPNNPTLYFPRNRDSKLIIQGHPP